MTLLRTNWSNRYSDMKPPQPPEGEEAAEDEPEKAAPGQLTAKQMAAVIRRYQSVAAKARARRLNLQGCKS